MIQWVIVLLLLANQIHGRNVSFDGRALLIDGQRKLLLSASVHYPRSTPGMWPGLMKSVRDCGIDVIDTFAFWNGHETIKGTYDFTGRYDIVKFIQEAQKANLYVLLRIGPYVCAEWDLGGLPYWLRFEPNIIFRTYNKPFMNAMQAWVTKLVRLMKDNRLFYPQGGPIIGLQIENEYGLVESHYGPEGKKYMRWAAAMAQSLYSEIPWIMCWQDDAPASVINTCNGFYCDNWIAEHRRNFPQQPSWFTEDWPGWFQTWGGPKPVRPAEDVAFSVLRWIARGGTLMNYYMFHGGTNFGRTAGANMTTSYDYDAPLDEYGLPSSPKYAHLQALHQALHQFDALILGQDPPAPISLAHNVEAHVYGDLKSEQCVAFLSNIDEQSDVAVEFNGARYICPAWSVSVLKGCKSLIYVSATVGFGAGQKASLQSSSAPFVSVPQIVPPVLGWVDEPVASAVPPVFFLTPQEHLSLTKDLTDYLWYSTVYIGTKIETCQLVLTKAYDIMHIFVDGKYAGTGDSVDVHLKPGKTKIEILSVVVGLPNYGFYYEVLIKGLNGSVNLCGENIRRNTWQHVPGLQGEKKRYFDPVVVDSLNWSSDVPASVRRPLTWLLKKFNYAPTDSVVALRSL